jgi:hypothetical protein
MDARRRDKLAFDQGMPPRLSVLVVSRDDGGKVGT